MGQVEVEGQPKARRGVHMLAYRKVGIVGRSWFCLEGNRSCALFVFFPLDFSFYNLVLQFRVGVGWIGDTTVYATRSWFNYERSQLLACLLMTLMINAFCFLHSGTIAECRCDATSDINVAGVCRHCKLKVMSGQCKIYVIHESLLAVRNQAKAKYKAEKSEPRLPLVF